MAGVPGVRFLPNAITVLALCCGLTSIYFAMLAAHGQINWLYAPGAISAAAIFDSLDGPTARLLNSTSRIGAELDSLSDCVAFGVAPAVVTFIWAFQGRHDFGWVACLVFAVCVTLRLARFNSLLDEEEPRPWRKSFFTGVPAPAAGLLALIPLLMGNRFGQGWWSDYRLVTLWLVIVGLLAISRLPSIALKSVRVAPAWITPMLIVLVLGVAALFFEPTIVLTIGLLVYLLHLPYAGWKYLRLQRHPELWHDPADQRRRARVSGRRIRLTVRNLSVRNPRRRRVAGRQPDGSPLPANRRRGGWGRDRQR